MTTEEIVDQITQMPIWDQKEIIRRIQDGGSNTVLGRYRFPPHAYQVKFKIQ